MIKFKYNRSSLKLFYFPLATTDISLKNLSTLQAWILDQSTCTRWQQQVFLLATLLLLTVLFSLSVSSPSSHFHPKIQIFCSTFSFAGVLEAISFTQCCCYILTTSKQYIYITNVCTLQRSPRVLTVSNSTF